MKNKKKNRVAALVALSVIAVLLVGACAAWWFAVRLRDAGAPDEKVMPVRILWFEQYSADAVAHIAEAFTEETGIPVIIEQVSVPKFQAIAQQELASGYPRFDLLVGDSQWLGYGVENGYYEDLTAFVSEHKILCTFSEAAAKGYGEYPDGSGTYYTVPFGANTIVYAYRSDWFENPAEQAAFKERYGRDLAVPRTYAELRDIAQFFYRPADGRYGIVFPASPTYDVVSMLFGSILFGYGGSWGDRATCVADGHINNDGAVAALELYRDLYQYAPPEAGGYAYAPAWDRFFKGDVAMEMNFITHIGNNPYASSTRFFSGLFGPASRDAQLAGQGVSLVTGARNRDGALKFLDWWVTYETQLAFAEEGGLTTFRRVTASQRFKEHTPYNEAYAQSIEHVRDFWNVPRYSELLAISQLHLHDYLMSVSTSTEAAEQTLATILAQWQPILATACKK